MRTRSPDWRPPDRPPSIAPPPTLAIKLLLALATMAPVATLAGWELQTSPTAAHLYDVTANHADIDIAWACGEGGIILFTSDGGATWTHQESGTASDLYGIAFHEVGGGPLVAVGANGTILRTTNMGTTWTQLPSGTSATLRCVSDFGFFIVGEGGTILEGTDLGAAWSPVSSGTSSDLYSVSGAFSAYAVGEGGTILARHITNWIPRSSGTTADLLGTPLFGSADYIAGDGGLILHSSNGGIDWMRLPVGTTAALRDIELSVNNTSRLYVVGDAGVIVKTTDHGMTWGFQQSGTAEVLHGVFFYLDDARGWAVGENGTILRTNDGGGPAVVAVALEPSGTGSGLRLASYPNPFRRATEIGFSLREATPVELSVFDVSGRPVSVLVDGRLGAGQHEVSWLPHRTPPGVYYLRLRAGTASLVRTVTLLE